MNKPSASFFQNLFSSKLVCTLTLLTSQIFVHTNIYAENILVFNVTGQPPLNTSDHNGFLDEVTREALRRVGYKLEISRLPAERGLRFINKGIIDGEMSRVKGISKIYLNLIRVEEKIMNWDFVVFSKKDIDLNDGWSALSGKYVSYMNGWKILEKNVPKSARVTKTNNSSQLFNLLKKERTDFIIYEYWGGHEVMIEMGLKNIKNIKPALASKEMFIYLHKKHADLAPKISAALHEMKKDGSYRKIEKKYLNENDS